MDWTLLVILQVMLQPSLSVLFTVEVERTMYQSTIAGDVVMGCRFQPKLSSPDTDLKVTWYWISPAFVRDVYRMDNRKEHLESRNEDYRGRVKLLTEQLQDGWARLQVSNLRINDSGTYQCLVQTTEGADYKTMTLSVVAPYKVVTKDIQAAEGGDVVLTCQSEGFPVSPVTWQDGHQQRLSPNNTAVSTPDQLFRVTSQIRVSASDKNNYTCIFANDGHSATFHIPDEIPDLRVKNSAAITVLSISMVMLAITVAVLMYRQRKGYGSHNTRNCFAVCRGRSASAAVCQEKVKNNEEEAITIFKGGCDEENLGALLKAHYAYSTEVRCHWEAFGVEDLPHRLQNNEGHPVNLQALIPEAGEMLFLEGPPGSGKTTTAQFLVSLWTQGSSHSLYGVLNLSAIPLLLYVDCSKVKGDLFQEITIQLSLMDMISTEEEMKVVLTRSSQALLVFDGYREGNQCFDESLRKFLKEEGGCRVLVMASPGHCPTLKDTVKTENVLQLQTKL